MAPASSLFSSNEGGSSRKRSCTRGCSVGGRPAKTCNVLYWSAASRRSTWWNCPSQSMAVYVYIHIYIFCVEALPARTVSSWIEAEGRWCQECVCRTLAMSSFHFFCQEYQQWHCYSQSRRHLSNIVPVVTPQAQQSLSGQPCELPRLPRMLWILLAHFVHHH